MNFNLELYRQMFISLKRGNAKGVFSKAKPILLLSIVENISLLTENKILWNDKKIRDTYDATFEHFPDIQPTPYWKPFFYLNSEPFYSLIWRQELSNRDLKFPSNRILNSFVEYAKLDDELWNLLQDENNREYLKNVIIKTYLS